MVFFIFKPAVRTEENRREAKQKARVSSFITYLNLWCCCRLSFTAQLIGQIPATVWHCLRRAVLSGQRGWSVFHRRDLWAMHALFRRWLPGRWQNGWSEKTIIFAGFYCRCHRVFTDVAITSGWMVYPVPIRWRWRWRNSPGIGRALSLPGHRRQIRENYRVLVRPDQSDRRGGLGVAALFLFSVRQ